MHERKCNMVMKTYTKAIEKKDEVPQSMPIPGSNQVKNSAGGFSFEVDDFTKLERFLILGTEGGSYYASEKKLTLDNVTSLERCIKTDGLRTVRKIVEISDQGRAPKNDPAIFALISCMKSGDEATRKAAADAFSKVVRIGTHLFQAAEAVKVLGGWGRGTKRAFTKWYESQTADELALQLAKYQSREGWSHRDVLRKLHINPKHKSKAQLFKWAVGKELTKQDKNVPDLILGFEEIKKVDSAKSAVKLIEKYSLPRECVPTQFLNSPDVWRTLLMSGNGMPLTAMVRNLGKMTSIGLLTEGSDEARYVVKRLSDFSAIKRARLHPMQILLALRTYANGSGFLGSLSWNPARKIVDALDDAFYGSFKTVDPTGKRLMLAMDISGSMHSRSVAGAPLTPAEASIALALIAMNVEQDVALYGFGTTFQELQISKNMSLYQATDKIRSLNFGGTDCALPMQHAERNKLKFDAFNVYTDNETWAGTNHPSLALKSYRKKMKIPAKLVVVGMVSNSFSIADPNDAGMLDVVGFDTATPALMADFIRD